MPTPLFGPDRGFRMWHISEIYTGPSGSGAFVPNINDGVVDWATGLYRVIDVDGTTGLSTMIQANLNPAQGGVLEEDVLLGSGPGTVSESYRLYINTETVPHSLAFDARLRVYGPNASHVKVFRGTNIGDTGQVISAVFNSSNVLISQNIPLQTVVIPGISQSGIKTPAVASSIETLQENEVCTAVVYDVGGTPLSYYKMLVRATNFIRTSDASQKYIVGIDLLSPFLSATNNNLVEIPINLIVQAAHFQGRVRYSDGSSIVLPVDDVKFRLFGINNYIASVLGQQVPLVLTYYMAANEYAYGDSGPEGARFIAEDYTLTTVEAQGAYSVKVFAIPRWQTSPTSTWVLDFYMYNLDRDEIFEVTPNVQISPSTPFNGLLVNGSRQQITITLNLQSVSPSFNYFQHVQTFWISLTASGGNNVANGYWKLEYTDGNVFGENLEAVRTAGVVPGEYAFSVSNGFSTLNDWLAAMYNKIEALYLPGTELAPPVPTHFRMRVGPVYQTEVMVAAFNVPVDGIPNTTAGISQGQPLRLEFFRREGMTDYELGVASLTIQVP